MPTITYANGARVIIRPKQIMLKTMLYTDHADGTTTARWSMTEQQFNDIIGRQPELGCKYRAEQIVFPAEHVDTVLAIAAELWGQPTDTDGYAIPADDNVDTPEVTEDAVAQQMAHLIVDEYDTIDQALTDRIRSLRHEREQEVKDGYRATTEGGRTESSARRITALEEEAQEVEQLQNRLADLMGTLPELWTIERVATYIGASSTGSARRTLSRWEVAAVSRQAGRGGQSLYNAAQVREAKNARPGRGKRNDLPVRA
jgi:hypothetical protein